MVDGQPLIARPAEGFGSINIVGREDDIRAICASLRGGHHWGALVLADTGLGKSALSAAVRDRLGRDYDVVEIFANSTMKNIAFGVLSPLLGSLAPAHAASPLAVMRAAQSGLARAKEMGGGSGEPPLLVVDNAHELDPQSAALIAQLVTARVAKALLLGRRDPAHALSDLVADGIMTRHLLRPLTAAQVHDLCVQVLGGPVLHKSSEHIAWLSSGVPVLVLALVSLARRTGTITEENGIWLLGRELPGPDERVRDLVRGHLHGYDEDVRAVLETVAFAEPLQLGTMLGIADRDSIDAMTEAHMVKLTADNHLHCASPLYARAIREMVPVGRSLRLRAMLRSADGGRQLQVPDVVRDVNWALDCGEPTPDNMLVLAAVHANDCYDAASALRAACLVEDPFLRDRAKVQRARALHQRGDTSRASALLSEVFESAEDARAIDAAGLLEVAICLHRHGVPDDLRSIARRWRSAVDRTGPAAANQDSIRHRGPRMLELYAAATETGYTFLESELSTLQEVTDNEDVLPLRIVASLLLAETCTVAGSPVRAVEFSGKAWELVHRDKGRLASYREFVLFPHLTALIHAGRWEAVTEVLDEYDRDAPFSRIYHAGTVNLAHGLVSIHRNDWYRAQEQLHEAVAALRVYDSGQLLSLATSLAAYAAMVSNERKRAAGHIAAFHALPRPLSLQNRLLSKAYIAAASGIHTDLKQLHALAKHAREAGMVAIELEMLCLAGDHAGPQWTGRLREIVRSHPGTEARAKRLQEIFSSAKVGHQSEPASMQAITRLSGQKLTKRERAVAGLAVQGLSNAEIARQIAVSVRTVEGHLYRVYEKLDISRRQDLARLLDESP